MQCMIKGIHTANKVNVMAQTETANTASVRMRALEIATNILTLTLGSGAEAEKLRVGQLPTIEILKLV